ASGRSLVARRLIWGEEIRRFDSGRPDRVHVGVSHLGRGQAVTLRRRVRFPYAHPDGSSGPRLSMQGTGPRPARLSVQRIFSSTCFARRRAGGAIMTNYGKHFTTLATPQTAAARADQRQNAAGGYAFVLDKWAKLDRFLILGSE